MARKTTPVKKTPSAKTPSAKAHTPTGKTTSTPVRNSAIPKKAVGKKPIALTQESIAERAYFISLSGTGGSELDNWYRAQRELAASL